MSQLITGKITTVPSLPNYCRSSCYMFSLCIIQTLKKEGRKQFWFRERADGREELRGSTLAMIRLLSFNRAPCTGEGWNQFATFPSRNLHTSLFTIMGRSSGTKLEGRSYQLDFVKR